jgi:hypothetical protein
MDDYGQLMLFVVMIRPIRPLRERKRKAHGTARAGRHGEVLAGRKSEAGRGGGRRAGEKRCRSSALSTIAD